MAANPSRRQTLSQWSIAPDKCSRASSGDESAPWSAKPVAGRLNPSRGTLPRFKPQPIATLPDPACSIRMPALFSPSIKRSLGHFNVRRAGVPDGKHASAAPCTDKAAIKERSGALSPGFRLSSKLAYMLPGSETQERPKRPRPAVWMRAMIHNGPPSPDFARRLASRLVESSSSKRTKSYPSGRCGFCGSIYEIKTRMQPPPLLRL